MEEFNIACELFVNMINPCSSLWRGRTERAVINGAYRGGPALSPVNKLAYP